MSSKVLLFVIFLFFSSYSFSQSTKLSGAIKDTTSGSFVKNAVVALLSQKDSVLVRFARTNAEGKYTLPDIPAGKYVFMVIHPAFADYVEDIAVSPATENMPVVAVTPKSKLLEAVILKSGAPIRIKGDTTVYTADSFKVSANANVEELLKKMPGIQVDKNGQIKAMGETVEKVLVDGEEFFGDDPGMAVKNLRADAVKEVQVFKKKTDQAEFTGIDDGQSKQTINLKLKEDKKRGYFGKIDGTGGPLDNKDPRYNSNLMLSSFKGKRKLTGFLLNGNTGQDGLSWQDMEKYAAGDMNMEMSDDGGIYINRSGGSDEEPYVNTQNGFITNLNAGLQYNNKFNDKNLLNFSPKFNSQDYDNNRTNFVQRTLGEDSLLNENSSTKTHVNRYNLKTNASYDMKLDSNNSLKIIVNGNIYHTESDENRVNVTTDQTGLMINNSNNDQRINSDKQSFGGSALFRHKFAKNRRTLSVNASWNMLNTDAENYLKREYEIYKNGISTGLEDTDQFTAIDKSTQTISSKVVYTEPLSKKFSVEVAHEVSLNAGTNKNNTYEFSVASGKYDAIVDSLTNNFEQSILVNKPSLKLNYAGKKIKYNFGAGVGFTSFDLNDLTYQKSYNRHYTNFFPTAVFTYNYKSNNNLRINYNGTTRQPSLTQLQPLRNNNDQFNQYIGNPDLKQSFSHQFNINLSGYDFLKERHSYVGISSNFTQNGITNALTIVPGSGYTVTQPINTDGNMSLGLWGGLGMKIKKLNMRLNFSPNLNYNKSAEVVNSRTNFSKIVSAGLGLGLSKTLEKKYEFSLNNNFNYNNNTSTLLLTGKEQKVTRDFKSNTLTAGGTVYYKKVWSVVADYSFFYREKTSTGSEDLNNHLLNMRLQRTFNKDEFTVYVQGRDLLNQNIGIERNFSGIRYTEERNDRLKRYVMLGFKWDFRNNGSKVK